MGFRLQRQYRLDFLHLKSPGFILPVRRKLLNDRTTDKGAIILVGRYNIIGIGQGRFFDKLEKGRVLFFAVDDENAIENLMSAMF